MGEAAHPGPVSRRRRRMPALPWSWDSDSELETDPRQIRDGVVRTQVDSCSDVPSDLLDAMERDLTMEIPRRRVKRAFNNGNRTSNVSADRFHVFSSEDEHRHLMFSDDEPLIPSSRVDPHESVTQPPSGLLPTWLDEPLIPSSRMDPHESVTQPPSGFFANVGGRTFDPQHM